LAIPVLLILAVLWAAVLVPPVLRSRSESRRRGSVGDFAPPLNAPSGKRARPGRSLDAVPAPRLGSIRPPGPAGHPSRGPRSRRAGSRPIASGAAAPMTPAQRRRRNVLIILAGGAIASLLVGLVLGSPIPWIVHVLADVLLVVYVVMLVQYKKRGSLAALQNDIDTWPPASRSTGPLAHPRVPPRPKLAPVSPEGSSQSRAAAK
jgi:hypothetical protein